MFRLGMAWGKRRGAFRWRAWRWTSFGLLMLIFNNASSFWLPVLSSEGQVLLKTRPNSVNQSLGHFPDDETRETVWKKIAREELSAQQAEWRAFSSYAASCYPDPNHDDISHSFGSGMCGLYVRRYINTTVSFPGSCPFAQDLCAVPLDQVIRIDSGRINSHDHLGINSAPHARLEIQTSVTCSPLQTDGYMTSDYVNHNGVNDTLLFYYGDNWYAYPAGSGSIEEVYDYSRDFGSNITYYYTKAQDIGKERPILLFTASEDVLQGRFPHPPIFNMSSALRTSDAPVTLFFLTNRLDLNAPVSDPWLNNTRVVPGSDGNNYYGAYRPVSPLGCAQTHAFCNPNTNQCIDQNIVVPEWFSGRSNDALWDKLGLNAEQRLLAKSMEYIHRAVTFGESNQNSLGTDELLLSRMMGDGNLNDIDIPNNHWQREVQNFMNLALSRAQGDSLAMYQKPAPTAVRWGMIDPWSADPMREYMHSRIKVRSHRHQSFSVAALALVIAIQGAVIFAGLLMQFLWPWLRLRKPDDSPTSDRGYKMWQLMGAVQLHRCLHQLLGRGRWRGAWHQIPTTDPGSSFSEYGKLPWQPYVTLEQEQALSRQAEGDAYRHGGVTTTEVKGSLDGKCEDSGANSSVDTLKHA